MNWDYGGQIDEIFQKTVKLDGESIVAFIQALVDLSLEDFKTANRLMRFSMQKLVEVNDWNMDRIKFYWMQMWKIMQNYFVEVACRRGEADQIDVQLAMFAIDSLK